MTSDSSKLKHQDNERRLPRETPSFKPDYIQVEVPMPPGGFLKLPLPGKPKTR